MKTMSIALEVTGESVPDLGWLCAVFVGTNAEVFHINDTRATVPARLIRFNANVRVGSTLRAGICADDGYEIGMVCVRLRNGYNYDRDHLFAFDPNQVLEIKLAEDGNATIGLKEKSV